MWGKKNIAFINSAVSDLKLKEGKVIPKNNITSGFVGYVMTDEIKDGCGYCKTENFDSAMVTDPINTMASSVALKKKYSATALG